MLLIALAIGALIIAGMATATSMGGLSTRHDYKFSLKRPYFYLDNHTLPFYDYYGSTRIIADVPLNADRRSINSMQASCPPMTPFA